jgi:hypothetical protein
MEYRVELNLDTHPLVREYFGEQLRSEQTEAWREGNRRLYDHYRALAPWLPERGKSISRGPRRDRRNRAVEDRIPCPDILEHFWNRAADHRRG